MDSWIRSLAVIDGKQIKVKVDGQLEPLQARELAKRLCDLANIIDAKEDDASRDEEAKWGPGPAPPKGDDFEE